MTYPFSHAFHFVIVVGAVAAVALPFPTVPPSLATIDFVLRYFQEKDVIQVVSIPCWNVDSEVLMLKKFSKVGIRMGHLQSESVTPADLTSPYLKLGIFIDLKCNGNYRVLRMAHENELFVQANSITVWIVLLEDYISPEEISSKTQAYQPRVSNPVQFLLEPYLDTNNSDILIEINCRFNSDFIEEYRKSGIPQPRDPETTHGIDAILPLNLLFDNQVILAVPDRYDLYRLYVPRKMTKESKIEIFQKGSAFRIDEDDTSIRPVTKTSLNGALLRAVTAIYNLKKFTRLDDLATRDSDAWAKMTYSILQLLKDDLNFSTIVRFFDDYGWLKNKSFNALMGHLQKRKADISAAGLLFRPDRFDVIDYMDSPFRLQTGIIFREPSLSSVTNIFLHPFSTTVWSCMIGLILLMMFVLKLEAEAGMCYKWLDRRPSLIDIIFSVLSAVGQQGCPSTPVTTTARLTIFLLLFTCLALFTAFSAKIVAVLQSFSSSVLSVKDITHSNFEVGIQANFPLFNVVFQEDVPVHEVIRDFYNRKILRRSGSVHLEPKDGIEKIRRGLFAFEVELTAAYKLISDTYEEIDKCGLKEIDVFPKPYLGTAVQKRSQFKETFTRRLRWFAEVGLMSRAWKRWIPQRPKCEAERIGFVSVGFIESYPAIMFFVYGFVATALILIGEILHEKISATFLVRRGQRKTLFEKRTDKIDTSEI